MAANPPPLRLSGSVFTLSVLRLESLDPEVLAAQITEAGASLDFLRDAPVVLDLSGIPEGMEAPLSTWVDTLRHAGCYPVGLRNAPLHLAAQAHRLGLPFLRGTATRTPTPSAPTPEPALPPAAPSDITPSQIQETPMRSGQRRYARGSDLTCLTAVHAGAEVLADGHLHVYGPLRGRALAGVSGDESAQIFCASLEAELIAIAGIYLTLDATHPLWGQPARIALDGEQLHIMPLGK